MDTGLLIARVVFGAMMAAHGTQKLFGWFGGYGLTATSGFFEGIGFRPGRLYARVASLGETVGGVLTALGLFGPVGPALMLSVMIVAAVVVHWSHGLFVANNGIEVPLLYGTMAVAVAVAGPGQYSLDAILGLEPLWTGGLEWTVLAAGAAGAGLALATRRTAASAIAA
jgi:putative oxidoreductase